MSSEIRSSTLVATGAIIVIILAVILIGWPNYNVWQSSLRGKAILEQAEYTRKVRIAEAKAKQESAELEAQADISRAKGTAEANRILGETLSPTLLQYQYIRMLEEQGDNAGEKTVIYIPTQNGLPVLPQTEAGRLLIEQKPKQ